MFSDSPDSQWDVSNARRLELSADILTALDNKYVGVPNLLANVSLALDFKFTRALPSTATVAGGRVVKALNTSMLHDCHTGLELKKLMKLDCSHPLNPDGSTKNASVRFSRVFNANYILGQTNKFSAIDRETLELGD